MKSLRRAERWRSRNYSLGRMRKLASAPRNGTRSYGIVCRPRRIMEPCEGPLEGLVKARFIRLI
jgi:hypothetical protein